MESFISEEAERCCEDSWPGVWPSERRPACRANTWSQTKFVRNVETLHPGPMHWEFNGNYSWRLLGFTFGGLSNQFGRAPFVVFSSKHHTRSARFPSIFPAFGWKNSKMANCVVINHLFILHNLRCSWCLEADDLHGGIILWQHHQPRMSSPPPIRKFLRVWM